MFLSSSKIKTKNKEWPLKESLKCLCSLHYVKPKAIHIWQRVAGRAFPTKAINVCKFLAIATCWLSRYAHLFLYPWGRSEVYYVHFFLQSFSTLQHICWLLSGGRGNLEVWSLLWVFIVKGHQEREEGTPL